MLIVFFCIFNNAYCFPLYLPFLCYFDVTNDDLAYLFVKSTNPVSKSSYPLTHVQQKFTLNFNE